MNQSDILTRKQAAELLSVSIGTLRNWETGGVLIPKRFGRRIYYTKTQIYKKLEDK